MAEQVQAEDLVAAALPVIQARHSDAWLVGGWVRDRLLGRPTHDIDFVVPAGAIATAREVADAVRGAFVLLDVERDTARVVVGPAGSATYLDFAGLRAPDIEADLLGRDFTVNAMAMPAADWSASELRVLDPSGGRADLAEHLLRAVSTDAFREDPLRMVRGVRLMALLGFTLESQTAAWMERDAELLDAVSRERVRDELSQIMALPGAAGSLRQLDELGLLAQIAPELMPLREIPSPGMDGGTVLEHSYATVDATERVRAWLSREARGDLAWPYEQLAATLLPYRDRLAEHLARILPGGRSAGVLLSLAALLHDVGKGARPAGAPGSRLLGHEDLGASLAATIMRRLAYSTAETVRVRLAVRNHMRPGQLVQEADGEPSRRAIYRFYRDAEPSGPDTILLSLADHLATRGALPDADHWRRHLALSGALLGAYYEHRQEVVEPPLVIDGEDLMSALGLAPGPEVGRLLDMVREAQAAGEVVSRQEAVALARRLLEGNGRL